MSLLRTLREYVHTCKDQSLVIRRSSLPAAKQFSPALPTAPREPSSVDLPVSAEQWELIGKGSSFHQRQVKESLKPLAYPSLRRSQTHRPRIYPEADAKSRYIIERSLQNKKFESSIMDELNRQTITQIIEALADVTPRGETGDEPSPIRHKDTQLDIKTPSHMYTEVPQLPDLKSHPEEFETYVHQLTHSTFHHKQSSKFNGIIPKILRNLFHPLNSNTLHIRTTHSFNNAIFFFVNKWDVATCRELLVQMKSEGKLPTTTTYNILLKALLTLQNIQHTSDPYKVALKHLKQMKVYRLQADVVTWNVMFGLLKDDFSKQMLLRKRTELKIPMDGRFMYMIAKEFSLKDGMNAKNLLTLVKELEFPLEGRLVNLVSGMLIKERQFSGALKLVEYAHKGKANYRANRKVLNMFLNVFAELKRVDLCVGIVNTFKTRFNVAPDYDSYDLLFESLARSGFWKEKYMVVRVLYRQMVNELGVIAGDYWLKRLRSRLKFIHDVEVELSSPLNEKELELQELMRSYVFDQRVPRWLNDPQLRKAGIKMGYYASRASESKRETPALTARKQTAQDYRERIDNISVHKAMAKRLPYARDPYAALKDELYSRNIIE